VALPLDVEDAVAAVRYARANGLRVAPQATGHNAGPLGSLDDTLLVDVRELQDVWIDALARRVRAGAGVKWERVAPRLSELGLAALHGSSPDVGIAGYSLGGGIARKYGLQSNSVTAIELVTADGRFRRVDASNDPDLFWELRGGNGNFGVVTAIRVPRLRRRRPVRGRDVLPVRARGRGPARVVGDAAGVARGDDELGEAAPVP
jgi:FAD/FMN-containing dehydrogenase